jgi:hypothetical protein
MAATAMTRTSRTRRPPVLVLVLAAANCTTVPLAPGTFAASKKKIEGQITDPVLRAKAIAIKQQDRIRQVHESHEGNPLLMGVKVRAEERRAASARAFTSATTPRLPAPCKRTR